MSELPFLSHLQRPSRYLGREINAVVKTPDPGMLRVVLAFPDLYEVGMSHLGLWILYDLLNRREDIWAERVYTPGPDLEAALRARRWPLGSLESQTPLREFDLVGISLQYELSYTNLLALLDLGGIPLLASDRGPGDPVVVGGGPLAMNPEPVAPFFDALVLGDGEEVILEVAGVVRAWRQARGGRRELWKALEGVAGVYVPALFEMEFDQEGRFLGLYPRGRRSTVNRRVLADLDAIPLSPKVLVPYCQIVHDRLTVEISRGCTRGCRYCQAGMLYRPVRERRPETVVAWVEEALGATGFEEVSLLSFSSGDYGPLPWLLKALMDRLEPRKVAVSLPSLRADSLTPEIMAEIRRVRRTGLTIAPEAGSDRLRAVINKDLPEETVLAAARNAFREGWRHLKLYFMIGLPTETEDDLLAIARLVRNIRGVSPHGVAPRLNVSLSTFIPKPHTPFQWEAQAGLEECQKRLARVKDLLKQPGVQVKWNSALQSWLEGIFSRGDRRLAPVLLAAYRRGCRLDAWSEFLRLEPWREAFTEAGVNPEWYLRPRHPEEPLPWDHLDPGVTREFLRAERERAFQGILTPDCREAGCQNCGRCEDKGVAHHQAAIPPKENLRRAPPPGSPPRQFWYRLVYTKTGLARWLSHLELVTAIYRSLRRAALPVAFTAGHHPLPRVAFHGALPVGVESLCETLDLALVSALRTEELLSRLNPTLPPGLKILRARPCLEAPPPPKIRQSVYQVKSKNPVFNAALAAEFLTSREFPVLRRRPKGERQVDLRSLVPQLTVSDACEVQVVLEHHQRDNLKITEILQNIFQLTDTQVQDLEIVKCRSQ